MSTLALIGLGGFLGANVRFAIASWSRCRWGAGFPWGTLIANLTGSFAMGLVLGVLAERVSGDRELRMFLALGFLGAETTFSTFAVETHALGRSGDRTRTLANIAANIVGSILAAATGLVLAWMLTRMA